MIEQLKPFINNLNSAPLSEEAAMYARLNETVNGFVGPFPFALYNCPDNHTLPPDNLRPLDEILPSLDAKHIPAFANAVEKVAKAQADKYNEFIKPEIKTESWNQAVSAYKGLIRQIGNWEIFLSLSHEMEKNSNWLHAVKQYQSKLEQNPQLIPIYIQPNQDVKIKSASRSASTNRVIRISASPNQ